MNTVDIPNKIDPASIPDAFIRKGIKPGKGAFFEEDVDDERECFVCLIGERFAEKNSIESLREFIRTTHEYGEFGPPSGLDPNYAVGLNDGWEFGGPQFFLRGEGIAEDDPMYLAGAEDGNAAYDACAERGMIERRS